MTTLLFQTKSITLNKVIHGETTQKPPLAQMDYSLWCHSTVRVFHHGTSAMFTLTQPPDSYKLTQTIQRHGGVRNKHKRDILYCYFHRCYELNLLCSLFYYDKVFDQKWHQVRLLVTEEDVTLYIDDLVVETLPLQPPVGIFINGKTQVGKYVSKETTVPVSV